MHEAILQPFSGPPIADTERQEQGKKQHPERASGDWDTEGVGGFDAGHEHDDGRDKKQRSDERQKVSKGKRQLGSNNC